MAECPAHLIGEETLAPCPFQGGNLQVRILVTARHPRVADFQEYLFVPIFRTRK